MDDDKSGTSGYTNTMFTTAERNCSAILELKNTTASNENINMAVNSNFSSDKKLLDSQEYEAPLYFGLTGRQVKYMSIFGLMNIFRAVAVLNNGPFFPPEAERRGATATEIGFIFASFDYTIIVASIIYGKYIIKAIGPLMVVKLSIIITGICTIIFGLLTYFDDHDTFVTFCFFVRIVGGAVDAGLYPSLFTIFSVEFPDMVAMAVGLLEVFFGIGAISGPIVCGALIDTLGYTLVYSIVGVCILISGAIAVLFLPTLKETPVLESIPRDDIEAKGDTKGLLHLLQIRAVWMAIFGLFVAALSIGFITATLELHMEEFELTSAMTGVVFSIGTAFYVFFSMIWGYLSDKTKMSKNYIVAIGAVVIAIGFSFLGPLPFLPWGKSLWVVFVGYSIHGVGIGASIMSSYLQALTAAFESGFADNPATYSLVSGVYTCTFSLGNAVGPSVGGVLFDSIGFRWGTVLVIGLSLVVIVLAVLSSWLDKRKYPDNPNSRLRSCDKSCNSEDKP